LKIVGHAGGNTGPGSSISGFKYGEIRRDAIDNWLAVKREEEIARQARDYTTNLWWTKIAAWAAIVSAVIAAAGLIFAAPTIHR
jgi:hypothetical protein